MKIVPKSHYLDILAKSGVLTLLSSLSIAASILLAVGDVLVWRAWIGFPDYAGENSRWFVLLAFASISLLALGLRTKRRVETAEPVRPLTRHTVNHIPAEESLVRASEEPLAGQEKILLRAAKANEETPAEQLLRPSE